MDNSRYNSTISPEDRENMLGHYIVVKSLGRGGMGEVLKAQDTQIQRYVAIKILDGEAYKDKELLKRFEREARSALSLDHPNIAKFYGMERDQYRRPFIVMEFIDGESMDIMFKRSPDIPFSRLTDFVTQVARGLESAYRKAIIHRDIKPSNLIIMHDDTVKIIDFGLAKSMFEHTMLTGTGMVVGTPRYISPEQAMGRSVDHRSDIYSLGATFYEFVTRQCPFDGDSAMAIMMKHINAPLVPPYMINPQVPGDINEIICRMLAKDPNDRYQDYEPLIRDLEGAKIQRMSKERRMAAAAQWETMVDGEAPTLLQEEMPTIQLSQTGMPASYMTEGLVDVRAADLPDTTPPGQSKFRFFLATALSIALIIASIIGYMISPKNPDPSREPSWLVKQLRSLTGEKPPDPKELKKQEAEADRRNLSETESRMDTVISRVFDNRRAGGDMIPTVRELKSKGMLTEEEARDAWGNDFSISSEKNGLIRSSGRNGVEGDSDDLMITLDGTERTIPAALQYDPEQPNSE